MSRSGYSYDCDNLALYRGQVASAIRGRRGQAMLRELKTALEEMPVKRLITDELEVDGEVCALGALGRRRAIQLGDLEADDTQMLAGVFGVARQLVAETMFMNDEAAGPETPEERWRRMYRWVCDNIHEAEGAR